MHASPRILAQAAASGPNNAPVAFHEMLPWLVLLLVLSVAGVGLVFYLRKRLFADDAGGEPAGLFADLRAMRDRGEITEEEYERTRAVVIARATGKDPDEVRAEAIRKQGGLVAKPGFDLTGRPLPGHAPGRPQNPPNPPADTDP